MTPNARNLSDPDDADDGQSAGSTPEPRAAAARDRTGDTEDRAQSAELGRRVTELELEVARLRTTRPEATSEEDRNSRPEPLAPPYIARAVIAVEGHLSDMERFAATGNEIAAQESRIAAASRCCSALRRLCDDDDFLQTLVSMSNLLSEHESEDSVFVAAPNRLVDAKAGPTILDEIDDFISAERQIRGSSFRELEIQLLQIAGLPEVLAEAHINVALRAYYQDRDDAVERLQNPMTFLSNLRALREASCLSADFLSQSLRHRQARQRWKKLLTFGLSGTLIVAANSVGTAILGPVGVAASGAIGSAAVGVAAQFVA